MAKAFQLGKYEPNPVATFATLFKFCDYAVKDGLLRVDEALQVASIVRTGLHHGKNSIDARHPSKHDEEVSG